MTQLYFDPRSPLLTFPCSIEYKRIGRVWLALDTGASITIIREDALIDIGYPLASITEFTTFGDPSQTHLVPKVTLNSLSLADARVENIAVLCYTMPEEYGIDGVIGLNFLHHFNMNLDFEHGILSLTRFD